ncbi:hypothetical protein DPX16_12911 [Anabarilius grahami]|uniref:Uncharacterized protein n=1 Tax=Anabarilius grahami TaxID=495550 RepID=A0A3N0XG55_ANAGA|nr:hypothetical protein DPX16_12911 [Anabarilius grahami]
MSATPADLEKTGNLPVTPRLILLEPGGSSIHTGIPSKTFCWNKSGKGDQGCTGKSYIQKNWENSAKKKTITVNTKVSNLLKRLMDFEWDFI